MGDVPFNVVLALVSFVGSGAVAFGAVRAALNGTRTAVTEIRDTLNEHVKSDHAAQLEAIKVSTRIATKLQDLLDRDRESREREADRDERERDRDARDR